MPLSRKRTSTALATVAGTLAFALLPFQSVTAAGTPEDSGAAPADEDASTERIPPPEKEATATGHGGAVSTLDPYATEAGLDILRQGGNAVDAAIAASAVLGVTRPYDGSIGGGGFFVIHDGETGEVTTIDSRERAADAVTPEHFIDPETGEQLPFTEARVSGLSVGVPGLVRGWDQALDEFGSMPFSRVLNPAVRTAQRGFTVDAEYERRTENNLDILSSFTSSADTFLVDGEAPAEGSVVRNPDLARTYQTIARQGTDAFYTGDIAEAIAETVTQPPVAPDTDRTVRPGEMTVSDLESYESVEQEPTHHEYRGYDIYGMAPSSSGGATIGAALGIMEQFDTDEMEHGEALHHLIEASALAYADREAYLGDSAYVPTPLQGLLDPGYAAERAELVGETAAEKPVASGDPWPYDDGTGEAVETADNSPNGGSTTHLTVADKDGTVVSYTFTIESITGSGMTVPGHGFLLNNELTDFDFDPEHPANAPAGGKRPRSSMSPTIVLEDGEPVVALGSPGGSRIITAVMQTTFNQLDRGMTLPEAIAAPRLSQRNIEGTEMEAAWFDSPEADALRERGHELTETTTLNNVTGVAFLDDGRMQAAAEPERLGGGSAGVVEPSDGDDRR